MNFTLGHFALLLPLWLRFINTADYWNAGSTMCFTRSGSQFICRIFWMDLYVLLVAILSLTGPTLANTLVLSRRQPEKKADVSATPPLADFPAKWRLRKQRRNNSKLAKSLPKPGKCFWFVGANFQPVGGTKLATHYYPNLGSDASSVWNFCARPCDTEIPITLTRNFVSQFCNFHVGKTKNFEGRRLAWDAFNCQTWTQKVCLWFLNKNGENNVFHDDPRALETGTPVIWIDRLRSIKQSNCWQHSAGPKIGNYIIPRTYYSHVVVSSR